MEASWGSITLKGNWRVGSRVWWMVILAPAATPTRTALRAVPLPPLPARPRLDGYGRAAGTRRVRVGRRQGSRRAGRIGEGRGAVRACGG